jgi:uroporphyrinogen III methyltransferase/synthase
MSGRVVLVGAGPGDPGLLTVRGREWLARADVVVCDYLVHSRLLEAVRPDAEVIRVGTSHGDPNRLSQQAIEALLVARARDGKLVVRLKNGDPFLFGRGGEEATTLRAAGVPFEVVPGVTSALAVPAWAGIPVTHRAYTSLVTIATGHQAATPDAPSAPPQLPWDVLARLGGTLVFLMGIRHLEAILERLLANGLDPATPAALVERGTLGTQRTVAATVGMLAARAREAAVRAPAVLVVGKVVELRAEVAWLNDRPLLGRRIVVTRPRDQAPELARLFEERGAEVLVAPTIVLAEPADPAPLERAAATAETYEWICFTSANGVRAFFARFAAQGRDVRVLAGCRFAAIGPETAAALERLLLRPAVVASEFRAEGLLDALASHDLAGRRVLLPRAGGARAVLPEALAARGAHVDEVEAYRAVPPPPEALDELRRALADDTVDAITFTASSTVRHFARALGPDVVAAIAARRRPLVACIGPITADTAREVGLPVDVCPASYTAPALADALAEHFCNRGGDHLSGEGG